MPQVFDIDFIVIAPLFPEEKVLTDVETDRGQKVIRFKVPFFPTELQNPKNNKCPKSSD